MEPPRTERQVRSFLGKIQYISRFISRLSITCAPIFKLLRKNQPVRWNEDCQKAFDHIKEYLMNPPVLSSPRPGEPLILYLSVEDAGVRAMLAQPDAAGVEKAIYYISRKLLPIEEKYNLIEKTCMAVVWSIKKLRPYFDSFRVTFVSKIDPMKYLQKTPTLEGRLPKWLIQMASVDAEFVIKKTVKGRIVTKFLAENPVTDDESWELEFPNEHLLCVEKGVWKLYFDGSANRNGAGAFDGSAQTRNRSWSMETAFMGIESLLATGAKEVEVIGDSLLVIEHANERWKVEEDRLKPYVEYLLKKAALFDKITFTHIGRTHNRIPYALANLASAWQDLSKVPKKPFIITAANIPYYEEHFVNQVESEEEPWFMDILRYMKDGTFSDDATKEDRSVLRKMAVNYVLADGELYRRAWDGMLLRCVGKKEGEELMKKIHEGVCGTHLSGMSLARKIMRQGYFWVQMEGDCVNYVHHCKACQYKVEHHHSSPYRPQANGAVEAANKEIKKRN
ncbi:uncharacterized protein LOC105647888 [Jatropha curcas]|uniref:uncharacterized protein LOC105647888 n=1 Tax=Jatropha curcas TaxID=180498 RepID=UPI00189411B7|nr:uncharacterized protein LOC105647888 [Jatropha curcas]